jgi:RNA-binding protein
MPLTSSQIRHLRALAHSLKPVVMVGQHGLKESLIQELESALDTHELLKVKVSAGDREERDALIAELTSRTGAELVQRIGHVAVLFRRNLEKPKVVLPSG